MNIEQLINLRLLGVSYREIERRFGIPHSTAHYRVSRHKNVNKNNLYKIVTEEYLKSNQYSERDKKTIEGWLFKAKDSILNEDANDNYYTLKEEQNKAIRDTSPIDCWSTAL